jgi:hypothetical protein
MRKFILLGMIVFAISARAGDTPNWKQTSELIERAENNAEFRILQPKYPQYLGEFDVNIVCYASLFVNAYTYRAPTKCPMGDARLTHVHVTRGICTQKPGELPEHRIYGTEFPGEEDPCGT